MWCVCGVNACGVNACGVPIPVVCACAKENTTAGPGAVRVPAWPSRTRSRSPVDRLSDQNLVWDLHDCDGEPSCSGEILLFPALNLLAHRDRILFNRLGVSHIGLASRSRGPFHDSTSIATSKRPAAILRRCRLRRRGTPGQSSSLQSRHRPTRTPAEPAAACITTIQTDPPSVLPRESLTDDIQASLPISVSHLVPYDFDGTI